MNKKISKKLNIKKCSSGLISIGLLNPRQGNLQIVYFIFSLSTKSRSLLKMHSHINTCTVTHD